MTGICRQAERRVFRLLHGPKTRALLGEIHTHILQHNLHHSNQILAHFVSVCGSLDKMSYADRIFSTIHNPNILLFNSMIKGYSLCGPFDKSLFLFSRMRNRDICPDQYTFAPLIKSCSNLGTIKIGEGVHAEVLVTGFDFEGSIRVGVIELYTTCGKMEEAQKLFDEMPQRNVVAWNMMIRGFCKKGDIETGLCFFRQMKERSVVSWNSMIASLEQSGRDKEALELFLEMRESRFELDDATVVTVLPVCARLGAVEIGQWLHSYTESKGFIRNSISIGNSLVDFYSKCGNLDTSIKIFNEMPRKNVVSWNSMISGLAFNGKGDLGIKLFDQMMSEKDVKPNEATYIAALSCCAHTGLVEKGRELFASIEPKLEHYGCMVDVLGRSGHVKEAYGLIKNMAIRPNGALWGALLSACRTHGDLDLAQCVIKEVIKLEPWNSGNYVLLSNLYAEGGKWDEVEKVRLSMKGRSVRKGPGQSAAG